MGGQALQELDIQPTKSLLGIDLENDPLLTIEEVARYLQLKPETVRVMARDREIPAFKLRRRWRFRREDVEQWVSKMVENA